jgi:hypothetical protein
MRKIESFLIGLIFVIACLFLSLKVNLVTADLGRHLKNGELILFGNLQAVLRTNFYSAEYADFPIINHHWGSGVIFYLVHWLLGFKGLSIFFTALSLVTLWLFFDLARKSSRFSLALITLALIMPVFLSRREIRPELFSYFLAGVTFWLLWHWREERISARWLWILPVVQVIWINLHVYFFLGFLLQGVFFVDALIRKEKDRAIRPIKVGAISLLASTINPFGLKAILYPFKIFENYGYRLFENQSVLFLDKIVKYPPSLYFKVVFAVLVISFVYNVFIKKSLNTCYLLLATFFSLIAWTAVRNFTIFGLFALPIIAANLKEAFKNISFEKEVFICLSLVPLLLFSFFSLNSTYWLTQLSFGGGLSPGNEKAARFFLENKLPGPIFNNYDIGGYLIYYLHPQKVFVDNRPEAYPADFFQKTYIPAQEDNKVWKELDQKQNFQTIFFYRHDLTPWGQTFLLNRIKDEDWSPVYVDDWSIIFVKRNEENKEVIREFELPMEMFSVNK